MITKYNFYCESTQARHPKQLLCIKNGRGSYRFTPLKTYEIYLSIKSQWNNLWGVYDEFITHADNYQDSVNIYLLQATAHHYEFKYYYEDDGALFTTESLEEYNKRKNIQKFDL